MRIRKKTYLCLVIAIILCTVAPVFQVTLKAQTPSKPNIVADSAVLIDRKTGKVLFDKNAEKKMFPASTTKILSALVALDYLKPTDYVVVGDELNYVPPESSLAHHALGETIRADNLLRLLIIPSGNDTSCVIAKAVGKIASEDDTISYTQAEQTFCSLMNEKAKSLGAVNSHFSNPHGFHDANHYTTAHDMARIADAALKNPLFREIVDETEFSGHGAGDNPPAGATSRDYKFTTLNKLLLPGPFYYQYAVGVKTGFTDQAGHCLVASANKDGKSYVSVVFYSGEDDRFSDTIALFDYGFEAYNDETIQIPDTQMETLRVSNPQLGEQGFIRTIVHGTYSSFMSKEELGRIKTEIVYNPEVLADPAEIVTPPPGDVIPPPEDVVFAMPIIKTPVTAGDKLGTITYSLDDVVLFTDDILAVDSAGDRTFNTDVDYRVEKFKTWLFSTHALPYWIGFILAIALIVIIIRSAIKRKERKNQGRYHW